MELSKELLDELKCIHCERYLTCGPIYIRNTSGEAICGRCTTYETEPITRNKQYETVAKKMIFPCTHAGNGCKSRIPYSEDVLYNTHEQNCKFRNRVCPVGKTGECQWLGPLTALVQHCLEEHPKNVFNNPCTMRHDLTKECSNAYVIRAFDSLFMLHVKVCLKEAKIHHSLSYLGDSKKAAEFKYKLHVQQNEIMLSKPGQVTPEGVPTIQIGSCLTLCTNSLLCFLGTFESPTFTVNVQHVEPVQAPIQLVTPIKIESEKPQIQQCIRKIIGCHYKEFKTKMTIHERYFCPLLSTCFMCSKEDIGQIQQHYLESHKDITFDLESPIRVNYSGKPLPLLESRFLSSEIGKLICRFTLNSDYFEFDVITPLASDQLNKYCCSMIIKNTKSKVEHPLPLKLSNHSNSDWTARISILNIPSKKFDVIVFLKEIK